MLQCRPHALPESLGRAALRAGPLLALVACMGGEEVATVELELEGPTEVLVDRLGLVEGPRVVLSDGSAPTGMAWTTEPDTVAILVEGGVEAVGPGVALVTGRWGDQEVSWTLRVEPPIALHFVQPPRSVGVGEEVALRVQGRLGDQVVEAGPLSWRSSDDAILTVSSGKARGRAAGMAYITAESKLGSRATVQLQVTELIVSP